MSGDKRNIAKLQENDVAIVEFYQLKKEFQNNQPEWKDIRGTSDVTKTLWNMWPEIRMKDKILYRRNVKSDVMTETWQMIVPVPLRLQIVDSSHTGMTGGHMGATRTKETGSQKGVLAWLVQVCGFILCCLSSMCQIS